MQTTTNRFSCNEKNQWTIINDLEYDKNWKKKSLQMKSKEFPVCNA